MTTKTRQYALDAAVEVAKLFDTGYVTESVVNVVADRVDDQMQLLALELINFMREEHNVKALKLTQDQIDLYAKQFETDINKLRDQMAITAMNALIIAEPEFHTVLSNAAVTAEDAYRIANAMLKARGEI